MSDKKWNSSQPAQPGDKDNYATTNRSQFSVDQPSQAQPQSAPGPDAANRSATSPGDSYAGYGKPSADPYGVSDQYQVHQQPGYQQSGYAPHPGMPPVPGAPGQQLKYEYSAANGNYDNFFKALFDFNFTRFVTPITAKITYILVLAISVFSWLGILLSSFVASQYVGAGYPIGVLIIGPIVIIALLSLLRAGLEAVIAIIAIARNNEKGENRIF